MKSSSAIRYLTNFLDGHFNTCFSRPRYISFVITKNCNLRCLHCDIWKNKNYGGELDDEKWLQALEEIKNWLGTQEIEINGGEPLLKKELVAKLIEKCSQLNLPVGLNTNGTIIDRQTAKNFFEYNLKSVKISLYSLNAAIHDELRGMGGALDKTKQALFCLNELRQNKSTRIEIGMLLTRLNFLEIDSVSSYARQNKFDLIIQPLDFNIDAGYKNDWQINSNLWPEKEQVKKYLKPFILKKDAVIKNPAYYLKQIYKYYLNPGQLEKRKCQAPWNNLIIEPDGDVKLCFRSKKIGNIMEKRIKEIWYGQEAKRERNALRFCQKSCKIIGCNMRKQIKDLFL